jgi:hypothetical protein
MAYTDSFREQHKELVGLVQQIASMLFPSILSTKIDEVYKLLSLLVDKLKIHLAMEDKSLYPQMISSHNEMARRGARAFMEEMGTLSASFNEYARQWLSKDAIKADLEGFCTQTQVIFRELAERIHREETQLYILADKI